MTTKGKSKKAMGSLGNGALKLNENKRLHVRAVEFQGKMRLDVRTFYKGKDEDIEKLKKEKPTFPILDGFIPTGKGINIPIEMSSKLIDAIYAKVKAVEGAQESGSVG